MPNTTENNNINLRSDEVQEILTRVPNWMIRWGSVLFLSLIILLLFISWMVKYPDLITAQATITTLVPPQKEYAQISGKIDTIFIKENEIVYSGQPLAILENTANFQHVFYLESLIDTIGLKDGKFEFPLEDVPILFLGDIDSEYALFQNSYIQYKLNKDLQPYETQSLANEVSLSEQKNRLNVFLIQEELEKTELKFKEKDLERNKGLYKKGIISAQEFEKRQMEYLQEEQALKNLNISISQTKEAIAMAKKDSQSTDMESIRENTMLLKSLIQAFNQLKIAIEAWKMQYVLSSDIEGKVAFMNYWSKNQNVNKEDLIFIIIPKKNSDYIAKLVTPAANSGKIKVGQRVNIELTSFPETEFGVLKGEVEDISSLPNKEGQYLLDVSLPKELMTTYGKTIQFKQEMAGTADIITEDLRLLERIFYQLKNIFKMNSAG